MPLDRRSAIYQALDDLGVKDCLVAAAHAHAENYDIETLPDVLELKLMMASRTPKKAAYLAFVDGARWALERGGHEELVQENLDLHMRLLQVCAKYGIKPCPKCNTECVSMDADMTDCEACDGNGWIPVE